ncbi:hypothetical protein [Agrobacterium tumefaciens]|uniref:hypothetical protein n=1 Tax=Agrobacterium tumefaciens TaxID=358 RepID=UPI001574492B|nr:hypothetical protein [Agrobacterium tumefaciens]NTB05810.1 hypothetical protein [Agrobacterium tumefaciens]
MTARKPVSALEQDYGIFYDRTIAAAESEKVGRVSAAPLMREMNRVHQIVAGLGVVLRIVGGNSVLEDEFDPDVSGSPPPLSKSTVSMLTAMAASVCEELRDSMDERAGTYNDGVKS